MPECLGVIREFRFWLRGAAGCCLVVSQAGGLVCLIDLLGVVVDVQCGHCVSCVVLQGNSKMLVACAYSMSSDDSSYDCGSLHCVSRVVRRKARRARRV